MCPGYERARSFKIKQQPRRCSSKHESSSSGAAWPELPFSSLHKQEEAGEEDEGDGGVASSNEEEQGGSSSPSSPSRRRRSLYSKERQIYLHSYPFSRKLSLQDRLKSSLCRLKAAVWAASERGRINRSRVAASFKDKLKRCCCGMMVIKRRRCHGGGLAAARSGDGDDSAGDSILCAIPRRLRAQV